MMVLKIEQYNFATDHHVCRGEAGAVFRVDLLISGSFREQMKEMNGEQILDFKRSLVGKHVSVDSIVPYEYCANKVEIIS